MPTASPHRSRAAALEIYRDAIRAGLGLKAFHATLVQVEHAAGIELPALTRTPTPS